MFDTDVFVIGGGPAGIAAAIAARNRGHRVVLADGSRPPIDKACGEGLMPDSLAAAARLGIHLPDQVGFRFRGIRFLGEGHTVASDFPHGYGLGFRRTALHQELVEQAGQAGVEMLWSTPITGIGPNAVHLNGRSVSTRWIIGADGSGSLVRRWAGLDRFTRNSRRFAYRRHFACAPWTPFMEIYWGDACQIYVTPIAPNEICVALIARTPDVRLDEALPRFPLLDRHLIGVPASSIERGAVSATSHLKSVACGNVALVGDASGSIDAITGEGLCQAFQQSEALAAAISDSDLSNYERAHRRIAFRPAFMADMMLSMDRWPAIRRRALGAMAATPECFANMLAGHVGAVKPARLVRSSLTLGWRMLGLLLVSLSLFAADCHLALTPAATKINWILSDPLHTVKGTFKLKRGDLHFDPDSGSAGGEVVVDATSGESGSAPRDHKMHKNVLESSKYPEISFAPDHLEGKVLLAGTSNVTLHGIFTIHGAIHEITVPVQVTAKDTQLTADLKFDVPYVAWGMKNPSLLFLRVSEVVQIEIQATAPFH